MYVTKKSDGTFAAIGKSFTKGVRVAVSSAEFKYLKDTFPKMFEFEGSVIDVKETKETKPKAAPKRASRAKKSEATKEKE